MNSIQEWSATYQAWNSAEYYGYWDNDFAVTPGKALMINSNGVFNFISSGSLPASTPQYSIVPAYNFIMHPLSESALTWAGEGIGADIGSCNSVQEWNSTYQAWNATEDYGYWDNDFASEIGKPLMINSTGTLTWPSSKGEDYVYDEGTAPKSAPKNTSRTLGCNVRDQNGNLYNFAAAPYDSVTFKVWIQGREGEVQNQTSFGAGYTYSLATTPQLSAVRINAGNFTTQWVAGDSVVFLIQDFQVSKGGKEPYREMTKKFEIPTGTSAVQFGFTPGQIFDGPWSITEPSGIEENSALPLETKLHQNYPNPFNPTTTIKFDLKQGGNVKLNVYNYNGQLVKALVNGEMKAGFQKVNFDASSLSAGVYYYTLQTAGKTMTQKMVLVK
jgi:hypothetical protein